MLCWAFSKASRAELSVLLEQRAAPRTSSCFAQIPGRPKLREPKDQNLSLPAQISCLRRSLPERRGSCPVETDQCASIRGFTALPAAAFDLDAGLSAIRHGNSL